MKLLVKPKTKRQEKIIKTFLENLDIEFDKVEEDAAIYKTISSKKPLTQKEKKILESLDQSVDFVNKYKKGKTEAKTINQLLNEL
jgi:hypothetical protein